MPALDQIVAWMRIARRTPQVDWSRNHAGGVSTLFGLLAMVMMLAIGIAVDYSRWLNARVQTLAAIDAAVLAAGRSLQVNPSDVPAAMAVAQRYYAENTKGRAELLKDTITFKTEDNNQSVTADGAAILATTFLQLAWIDEMPLFEASGSEFSKAVLANGGQANTNIEVSLMLDTSGSMSNKGKFKDMQDAASDLVNIIVRDDQSKFTSKVAIAPFSADMRVPSNMLDAVRGTGHPASISKTYKCGSKKYGYSNCSADYDLAPCVAERKGSEKYTDAAPGSGQYVMPVYSNNGHCSQSSASEIVPLSSNRKSLLEKIDGLKAGGATAGHLGTAWAWYMLSPNWNSVWTGSKAAAYAQADTKKIAILMTDGEYNIEYDTNGLMVGQTGAGNAVNGTSIDQAKALCDGMKAKGITVYTVGFDLGGNQTAIDTLKYCANDASKYYNAEDGAELKQAFKDIALQLTTLHLTR